MKQLLRRALLGALTGIAVRQLAAILLSLWLDMGYLLTHIAPLAELLHGELPAVLLETSISGLLGMCVALARSFAEQKAWSPLHRRTSVCLSLLTGILPIVLLTLYLL